MTSVRRILGGFCLATVASAASLVAASPALAAYTCQSGQVCVYQNTNLTGSVYIVPSGCDVYFAGKKFANGDPLDDNASSITNLSGSAARLFESVNSQVNYYVMRGGETLLDLRYVPASGTLFPGGNYDNTLSGVC